VVGAGQLGLAVEYFAVYFKDIRCFRFVAVAVREGYVQNLTGKVLKKRFQANPRNRHADMVVYRRAVKFG